VWPEHAPGRHDQPGARRRAGVAARARAHGGTPPGRPAIAPPGCAAEPALHVRVVRRRVLQPVRARRGRRRRGDAWQVLQPTDDLRTVGPREDASAARHRALRHQLLRAAAGEVRLDRGTHQRLHQRHLVEPHRGVPQLLPRRRCPARRRHPVPGVEDPDAGGVFPHLQHPAQRAEADRDDLRSAAEAAGGPGASAAVAVRVGPHDRHPAARPRDPHRHPAQEGGVAATHGGHAGAGAHRVADPHEHPRARGGA